MRGIIANNLFRLEVNLLIPFSAFFYRLNSIGCESPKSLGSETIITVKSFLNVCPLWKTIKVFFQKKILHSNVRCGTMMCLIWSTIFKKHIAVSSLRESREKKITIQDDFTSIKRAFNILWRFQSQNIILCIAQF